MKRIMWMFLAIFAVWLLYGCADSSQTGLEKETNVDVVIRVTMEAGNSGDVQISPPFDWDATVGDTDQESAAVAEASPNFDTTIPIAQQGGQANVGSETQDAEAKQDNTTTITDSQNDNSVAPQSPPVVIDTNTPPPADNDDGEPPVAPGTGLSVKVSTYFHHTQFNGPDCKQEGNKCISLVLCPGDERKDLKCSQGDINIPLHKDEPDEDNRYGFWNMGESGDGPIFCSDGKLIHSFSTDANAKDGMVFGKCE